MKVALHARLWGESFDEAWAGAREAGFAAVETFCLSQWFPKPHAFREMLAGAGLTLAAMEYGGEWIAPERAAAELDGAERLVRFLAEAGAEIMVVSGGRRIPREPDNSPGDANPLAPYAVLSSAMTDLGALCREHGLSLCYHPKAGTWVEFRDQIDLLMGAAPADLVGLCLDTGDLARAGCDPLEVARTYGERVRHVHLKDLDWKTHRPLVPGTGSLELHKVLEELRSRGYGGWIAVELDRSSDPPADARAARTFLEGQGL